MKYLPVSLQKRWAQQANRPDPPSYMQAVYRRGDEEIRKEVGMLQKAGVGILAGEDVGGAGKWAGFSLHENLQEEVVAGLTPMEALQTATINAARFMGKEKDLGTIQKGKLADLVLLDANPLDDIHNTMKINSVVVNGRLLDRPAIDKMMSDVLAMNSTK